MVPAPNLTAAQKQNRLQFARQNMNRDWKTRMLSNIDDSYAADKVEDFKLQGNYNIKTFYNTEKSFDFIEGVPDYHAKAVFFKGNVLYKEDEPKIIDYINMLIKFTYTKPDKVVERNVEQLRHGTICPTREDIYEIDDKIFTLYGRYIYGYDDFEKVTFTNKTSGEKIFLKRPDDVPEENVRPWLSECAYSFKIVDKKTQILYAFGMYR